MESNASTLQQLSNPYNIHATLGESAAHLNASGAEAFDLQQGEEQQGVGEASSAFRK
jgi:hypothetical protein